MGKHVHITENWIKEKVKISNENLEDIKTLVLQGNYEEKINSLGNALLHFTRLKVLDLSRNVLRSVKGIEHIRSLEVLNLYYNCIEDLKDIQLLSHNQNLKDVDLRLNPVSRLNSDYRLYLAHILPKLKTLDCRSVKDAERKAALAYFASDQNSYVDNNLTMYKLTNTNKTNRYKMSPDLNVNNYAKHNQSVRVNNSDNVHTSPSSLDVWLTEDYSKLYNGEAEDIDMYHLASKYHDPWTSYFLRLGSKQNANQGLLNPTRGVKQVEYYKTKERLQTEIEYYPIEVNDKDNDRIGEKSNYQIQKSLNGRENCNGKQSTRQENSPKPAVREQQLVNSAENVLNHKKSADDNQIDRLLNATDNKQCSFQTWANGRNENQVNEQNTNSYDVSKSKMDNAFFLIMKNFIDEAVAESFARYKSMDLKTVNNNNNNNSNNHSNNHNNNINLSNQTDRNTSIDATKFVQFKTKPHRSSLDSAILVNDSQNVESIDRIKRSESTYLKCDRRNEMTNGENFVGETRNKELEIENFRLTAELERLKSRLRIYEQMNSTKHTNKEFFPALSLNQTKEHYPTNNNDSTVKPAPIKRAASFITGSSTQMTSAFNGEAVELVNSSESINNLPITMHQAVSFHSYMENHQTAPVNGAKFLI